MFSLFASSYISLILHTETMLHLISDSFNIIYKFSQIPQKHSHATISIIRSKIACSIEYKGRADSSVSAASLHIERDAPYMNLFFSKKDYRSPDEFICIKCITRFLMLIYMATYAVSFCLILLWSRAYSYLV